MGHSFTRRVLFLALAFAALGLAEAGEVRQRIAHLGQGGGASRALAHIAFGFATAIFGQHLIEPGPAVTPPSWSTLPSGRAAR